MSDNELAYDSDHDVSESHSKLIEAVAQLDKGQRVKKPQRSEPTLEVSEFHLVKSGVSDKDAVHVQDLAKVLGKKGHHADIARRLESAKKKTKLLDKPLEKPTADRIKRIVGFENTKKDLGKWNGIITKNRVTESIRFPLSQPSLKLGSSNEFVKRFRLQSDLEKELAALEPQKENIEEKVDEFSMTLNEIIMKRKEAARFRAQQSYKEAKAHRQKKIKSKKFHRVQRKERVKQQLKEFETLQKTDPEAALEKLEQLDKTRAEERMSLRHKSTGQWAKNKQIRAKYDTETRQVLAQQLAISRELTQKIRKGDDSDEENEESNEPIHLSASDKENPWVTGDKTESEIDDFIKGYRKYWDQENKKSGAQSANTSNKNSASLKQIKSSEDAQSMSESDKDHNGPDEHKAESHGVQKVEKVSDAETFNTSKKIANSCDQNAKIKQTPESNVLQSEKATSQKLSSKKKKIRSKCLSRSAGTSAWNVESVDVEDKKIQSVSTSYKFGETNTDKINAIFDTVEEKIQSKVKSKLETIKRKYEMVTKKKSKTHDRAESDEECFDGLEMNAKKQRPTLDEAMDETTGDHDSQSEKVTKSLDATKNEITPSALKSKNSAAEIDPNKYINVKPKHLYTQLPDDVTGGDDALDDSEDDETKHNIISEAFADDDVVDEFRKEKEDEAEKSKPQDIDLSLPGWGSWGGRNIRTSKRKKKRFVVKFPKEAPRKDENKGDVIIIEENNPKIRQHQVTELPYPFTTVKDFEASIRMPIGRNFVPENAHKKLIEPTVRTALGKIIEPMNDDALANLPEKKRRKHAAEMKTEITNKKKVANKTKAGGKKK